MTKSSEKGTELILEFVKYTWFSASLLPLARGVHCLLKKPLQIFALALRSVTNLLLTERGGITGALLSSTDIEVIRTVFFMKIY